MKPDAIAARLSGVLSCFRLRMDAPWGVSCFRSRGFRFRVRGCALGGGVCFDRAFFLSWVRRPPPRDATRALLCRRDRDALAGKHFLVIEKVAAHQLNGCPNVELSVRLSQREPADFTPAARARFVDALAARLGVGHDPAAQRADAGAHPTLPRVRIKRFHAGSLVVVASVCV